MLLYYKSVYYVVLVTSLFLLKCIQARRWRGEAGQIFGLFERRYFMDDPRFSQSSFMTPFSDTGWVIINWFLEMGYV